MQGPRRPQDRHAYVPDIEPIDQRAPNREALTTFLRHFLPGS